MENKLFSHIHIPEFPITIDHKDQLYSIGSCFSENIGQILADQWFSIDVNLFGTLFNPISILNLFNRALEKKYFVTDEIQESGGLYFLWDCHGKITDTVKERVLSKANQALDQTHDFLQHGQYLFITFGTAFYFELKKDHQVVANCHKQPQSLFERKKITASEIVSKYEEFHQKLNAINPNLKTIYTVSPVRHARDGFIANNRSKAELLLAIEILEKQHSIFYFPSYEIQMDELRDYRFYSDDFMHPNPLAIKIIFDHFKDSLFTMETKDLFSKISKIKAQETHRHLFPESEDAKRAQIMLAEKKAQLKKEIFG
ncbi:MAG: GSCFA domain-containing protein [Crocinitomicaceae bacterium]|nr:GSCFA domain-containing protein [Crocinitomicaceae bacterium]